MLTLSETATRKLTELFAQQQEPVIGLRVSVHSGGCSGYQYGMSLAPAVEDGDWVGEFGGVKVLVDAQSAPLLQGVNIDYVETLQASGFTIQNPNAVRGCGCGKSFEAQDDPNAQATEGGCGCGGH
ncbi:MAG: hypothetical protein A2W00_05905 [Candidatus Eisenbacteria bacterium RBG_16_71_46]|nr:MAG: hypothetical protein A2W00_05905 [Candidatus Eisenbacteria bacterium RBG_16_71_46]OGF24241.1 MAG: hypothetical protein A2V63_09280 [Candidatus Eisenbacteria bacterium RBG_19FT_COMBO_70_11]